MKNLNLKKQSTKDSVSKKLTLGSLFEIFIKWLKTFGFLFLTECVEEALEEIIAIGASWILSKTISSILVFFGIQATKTIIKTITILIKPIIKKYTYKEGKDKMKALEKGSKNLADFLATNPITVCGITINETLVAYVCYCLQELMDLPLYGKILACLAIGITLSVGIFFVFGKFVYEKSKTKEERLDAKEKAKEARDLAELEEKYEFGPDGKPMVDALTGEFILKDVQVKKTKEELEHEKLQAMLNK